MPSPREVPESPTSDQGAGVRRRFLAGAGLVLAVLAVYWNSLGAPFQFDDGPAILYNPTIRSFADALQPPASGAGVTGRPLVNLSLALNHALGGFDVRGYHALNLVLHALAVLALWGVLRRTPGLSRGAVDSLAFGVSLLWAVHPLLTESVVCVVQRNEILGGLFYLLTLHCFILGSGGLEAGGLHAATRRRGWLALSVASCLLGMASKEIVATAPLMVLLYDRTFVAGTFAAAWRRRKGFYLSLAATWLLLAWLIRGGAQRGGSVGFGLGMSSWDYLLTQCRALTTYLQLSVWPHPLVVDYGQGVSSLAEVWWRGLIVLALLSATVWALVRKPAWGFVGAWFFVILAPSSSFVPLTTQTMTEHRMYLPLVAVIVLGFAGLHRLAGRGALFLTLLLAVGLGAGTIQRNRIYQTELSLWSDTVAKAPGNPRAHLNLGQALCKAGRWAEAAEQFEAALRLKPAYSEAHYNLGLTHAQLGQNAAAIGRFEEVLRLVPDHAAAHNDLGVALVQAGRTAEAREHFAAAVRLRTDFAGAHYNLANLLLRTRRPAEAVAHFEAALRLQEPTAECHGNLAVALMQTGRAAEALPHAAAAVELAPDSPESRLTLALTLGATGRLGEAIPHLETALRLRPDFEPARRYLSEMQADLQRMESAKRR